MKVQIGNEIFEFQKPISLEEIAKQTNHTNAVCAAVDGRIRELMYKISDNADIEFLDLTSHDGMRIYEATLRYVFAKAAYEIDPKIKIRFSYSVSRSVLATVEDREMTEELYRALVDKVNEIIRKKLEIKRLSVSKAEATQIYTNFGYIDKIETLKFRQEDTVNVYQCGEYVNYMFSYMLPNTSYLTKFETKYYHPGFLIFFPRAELKGELPEFIDQKSFGQTLKEAYKWGKIIGGDTIANINKHTETRDAQVDFVNLCETKHNNQLAELGNMIKAQIDDVRLIAVAGPSSSGKTTFTNRLRIELLSKGIKPKMISMDDYYKPKSEAPIDEYGKPDLEHVEALDIERFNRDMADLVQGKEVRLPHFDFKQGKRVEGPLIKLEKDSPILIEGIHALNDRLTSLIPSHQKFKIFIAPQTQIHIDDHNPISLTDLRLLRRMVRDQKYRNTPVTMTMDMWPSVRRGEFRWIYPNQENVNYVFNSELSYELLVLKKYALPHLLEVPTNDKHFVVSNRLVKFLKYFKDIDEKLIPSNSILLEFIGGSPFHD
ncbi:nucleoside kinase [Acholeplasma hippikon]|uniref:Uridine kinase n=1 Tax=Acholeplasma hippikon TaxID=264636 RepID=A0A449BJH2_9MOLU|nr:nucleoside kinase [Acholeplasma hippikon]VEU82616.1 uridine kinase [Acholeplasma hippikon]